MLLQFNAFTCTKCPSYLEHFVSRRLINFLLKQTRYELKFFAFYVSLYFVARRVFGHFYGFTLSHHQLFCDCSIKQHPPNRLTLSRKAQSERNTCYARESPTNISRSPILLSTKNSQVVHAERKVASQLVQKEQPRSENLGNEVFWADELKLSADLLNNPTWRTSKCCPVQRNAC